MWHLKPSDASCAQQRLRQRSSIVHPTRVSQDIAILLLEKQTHGSATNLTVVVHFAGNLSQRRQGNLKAFATTWAIYRGCIHHSEVTPSSPVSQDGFSPQGYSNSQPEGDSTNSDLIKGTPGPLTALLEEIAKPQPSISLDMPARWLNHPYAKSPSSTISRS